jgi:hypothetical protein
MTDGGRLIADFVFHNNDAIASIASNEVVDASVEILGELCSEDLVLLGTVEVPFDLVVTGLNRSAEHILETKEQDAAWSVSS